MPPKNDNWMLKVFFLHFHNFSFMLDILSFWFVLPNRVIGCKCGIWYISLSSRVLQVYLNSNTNVWKYFAVFEQIGEYVPLKNVICFLQKIWVCACVWMNGQLKNKDMNVIYSIVRGSLTVHPSNLIKLSYMLYLKIKSRI